MPGKGRALRECGLARAGVENPKYGDGRGLFATTDPSAPQPARTPSVQGKIPAREERGSTEIG
jgi:hypothetical protein